MSRAEITGFDNIVRLITPIYDITMEDVVLPFMHHDEWSAGLLHCSQYTTVFDKVFKGMSLSYNNLILYQEAVHTRYIMLLRILHSLWGLDMAILVINWSTNVMKILKLMWWKFWSNADPDNGLDHKDHNHIKIILFLECRQILLYFTYKKHDFTWLNLKKKKIGSMYCIITVKSLIWVFTKSPDINDSRLILQLSLPNPLKPGVKSRMKI